MFSDTDCNLTIICGNITNVTPTAIPTEIKPTTPEQKKEYNKKWH